MKRLLLAAAAVLAVAGCASSPRLPTVTSVSVKHAMGTAQVPVAPKRVVVLDTDKIDSALTLGIKPVGAARAGELTGWPTYFGADAVAGIKEVGTLAEPNLEAGAQARPDPRLEVPSGKVLRRAGEDSPHGVHGERGKTVERELPARR